MNRAANKGFTLTELMLAMGFISVLILAIAMTVVQVSTIYYKGMTLREVNQAGREMSNDFRRMIASRDQITLAADYVEVVDGGQRVGGRLCTGSITYVWNYGEALQEARSSYLVKYGAGASDYVRIGKVTDPTKKYCAKDPTSGVVTLRDIPSAERSQFNSLLSESDRSLNIYRMALIATSQAYDLSTNQRLYTIEFTLGSGESEAMEDDFSKCKEPGTPGADIQYCMVEHFSLVVRAGNRVN
jgi:hypothetical protein